VLREIESKANNAGGMESAGVEPAALALAPEAGRLQVKNARAVPGEIDDGRAMLRRIFVDSKVISGGDFDLCWRSADLTATPAEVIEPFIQVLHDKGILLSEKSLKLLSEKSRMAYLPLDKYDVDIDLTRGFPAEVCRRWCVLPFDRMSKAILVATANPFNQQAVKELSETTSHRLVWYLVPPADLMGNIRKAFR